MKLGVCAQVLFHLPFHEALSTAARMGFEAIELPVHAGNPFVDLDAALEGGHRAIRRAVMDAGLTISALSNHREGQRLFGPYGRGIERDAARDEARHAVMRLEKTAALAEALGVSVVIGFTGCEAPSQWFPWPDPAAYEAMAPAFVERMTPLLEAFCRRGVRFAHECHPNQLAYNIETARWMLDLLGGHPALGWNLDPANLMLAGVDPVVFIAELGERILHVHAKDGELVAHHAARSGLLAHGSFHRRDRGFRFRVPGWGDLSWRRIISELQLTGYDGVLAIEHEDPTMSRIEGLEKAIATLAPLLIRTAPEPMWW